MLCSVSCVLCAVCSIAVCLCAMLYNAVCCAVLCVVQCCAKCVVLCIMSVLCCAVQCVVHSCQRYLIKMPHPHSTLHYTYPRYAIGGLAGGEDKDSFWRVVAHVRTHPYGYYSTVEITCDSLKEVSN